MTARTEPPPCPPWCINDHQSELTLKTNVYVHGDDGWVGRAVAHRDPVFVYLSQRWSSWGGWSPAEVTVRVGYELPSVDLTTPDAVRAFAALLDATGRGAKVRDHLRTVADHLAETIAACQSMEPAAADDRAG